MDRSYIAFISYKHQKHDAAIAKAIHEGIEAYRVPKELRKNGARGLGIVFRDEEELPLSSDLDESIHHALDHSTFLIVICSPESKASPWVQREIDYFLQHHDHRHILAVLASGEPGDVFPDQIVRYYDKAKGEYVDIEPLAIDARAETREKSLSHLKKRIKKLYAAMLGCPYDALVQREKKRRSRRIAMASGLLLSVLIAFIGVLVVKNGQLTKTNLALQESNNTILLRESELLTAESAEALEQGRIADAISYAVEALPYADHPRPYSARAEVALFNALDPFNQQYTEGIATAQTALRRNSPIQDMVFANDGRHIITADNYGKVLCHQTSDLAPVWECALPDDNSLFESHGVYLFYIAQSNTVIGVWEECFTAMDATSGEILWQYQNDAISYVDRYYLSPSGNSLAFYCRDLVLDTTSGHANFEQTQHYLLALDTKTGQPTASVPLYDGVTLLTNDLYIPSTFLNGDDIQTGFFLNENTFVAAYHILAEGVDRLDIISLNLKDQTRTLVYSQSCTDTLNRDDLLLLRKAGENEALLVRTYSGEKKGLQADLIDLNTASLRWSRALEDSSYSSGKCHLLQNEDILIVGAGKQLYCLDKLTGEIKHTAKLNDTLLSLFPADMGMFGFVLKNGYYAVGWLNAYGFRSSETYSVSVAPDSAQRILYNRRGFISPQISDGVVRSFSGLTPQQDGGWIAAVSGEDQSAIYLTRAISRSKADVKARVDMAMGDRAMATGGLHSIVDPHSLILGPMVESNTSTEKGKYVLFHTDTLQVSPLPRFDVSLPHRLTFIVEPPQIAAIADSGSDAYLLREEEEPIVLIPPASIILSTLTYASGDTLDFTANQNATATVRLNQNKGVLTAACDGESLTLWLNGVSHFNEALPENILWRSQDQYTVSQMLHASFQGHIVLSHFADSAVQSMDSFAVFDMHTKGWTLIPDAAQGSSDRLLRFSETSPLFCVMDADQRIRVYNMKTAKLTTTLPLHISAQAVQNLGFAMEDALLWVVTKDQQLLMYDLSTLNLVYSSLLPGESKGNLLPIWDNKHSRLYLCLQDQLVCICVDTRSWQELFRVKDCVFFLPEENALLTLPSYTHPGFLQLIAVPTTEELVQMGRESLSSQF